MDIHIRCLCFQFFRFEFSYQFFLRRQALRRNIHAKLFEI
jgi:hypothetical protein